MTVRSPPSEILAVISDVDGTLVTDGKILTSGAVTAIHGLRTRGIAFAIISSRPPRGMAQLVEPLGLTTPMAGFNGGMLTTPHLALLEQHLLAPEAARQAVATLAANGADAWVFSGEDWLVRDARGLFVDREIRTVRFEPTVVENFGQALEAVGKIVGVSSRPDVLARCQADLQSRLAGSAAIARSQRYYLDITHPLANKGDGLRAIARHLDLPAKKIAVIGDGPNDVAMFQAAGLSIAMGNADAEVQAAADHVTGGNNDDGFAQAMARFLPSRAGA